MKNLITMLLFVIICASISVGAYAEIIYAFPNAKASSEIEEAIELGFVPDELQSDYKKNITRAEFIKTAVIYLAETQNLDVNDFMDIYLHKRESPPIYAEDLKNPFSDTEDFYLVWGYALGLLNYYQGVGNVFNPEPDTVFSPETPAPFNPDFPVTRQEAASVLYRVCEIFNMLRIQEKAFLFRQVFSDAHEIPEAISPAAALMYQMGVMNGMDEDTFNPTGYITREQCATLFLRLYKYSPDMEVLLPYDEALGWIIGGGFPEYKIYNSFECENYSVYYGGQTGTPHGQNYTLWIVYRSGGMREILHDGEGLPSSTPFRNDLVLYNMEISGDESTLTFKYDFDKYGLNSETRNYSVDLVNAKLAEI